MLMAAGSKCMKYVMCCLFEVSDVIQRTLSIPWALEVFGANYIFKFPILFNLARSLHGTGRASTARHCHELSTPTSSHKLRYDDFLCCWRSPIVSQCVNNRLYGYVQDNTWLHVYAKFSHQDAEDEPIPHLQTSDRFVRPELTVPQSSVAPNTG